MLFSFEINLVNRNFPNLRGYTFHIEDQKRYFLRHKEEPGAVQRAEKQNPGFRMLSLCVTLERKNTSKIECGETTFLHLATDTTSCLHR